MTRHRSVRGALLGAACALAMTSARAAGEEVRPASPQAKAAETPQWGASSAEVVNVHAYAFQANTSSDLIRDDGFGYRFFAAPSAAPYMAAPVRLPTGAQLGYLSISHCMQAEGDLVVSLYDNGVGGSGSGGGTLIQSLVAGSPGCGESSIIFGPSTYAAAKDHPLYVVVYFAGSAVDGTTRFNNVTIGFTRDVSPEPATATFNDVPTTDPAFQHIEALVASGITGGCGGARYCPDAFVTRRQMAVFLAKALGLHWPN